MFLITFNFRIASLSTPELGEINYNFLTANILQFFISMAVNTSPEVPEPNL